MEHSEPLDFKNKLTKYAVKSILSVLILLLTFTKGDDIHHLIQRSSEDLKV